MKCPKCGGINRDGSKYCQYCGENFASLCPKCGASINEKYEYCPQCGAKLEREGKKLKKVEYNLRDGDVGFRYAYLVSYVLLFLEVAVSLFSIIKGFSSYRVSGPGYYSVSSYGSFPPYSTALLVLSIVTFSGLRNFKKSSFVILMVIHALLILRDFGYIKIYLFNAYGSFILYGILALVALVLHILSLVYFIKREKYYTE